MTWTSNQSTVPAERGGMKSEVRGRLKREGTRVYPPLMHVDVWQKSTQYCYAIILRLKINTSLKILEKNKINKQCMENRDHLFYEFMQSSFL